MSTKVAIVGKMHSGKTTLAQALVDYEFTRMAFADPVKEVSAQMLNTFLYWVDSPNGVQYDGESINTIKGHPSIRKLLQLVGTELGREWLGPDTIWIDTFRAQVEAYEEDMGDTSLGIRIVNDDCRFPNEADRLRDMGFTIIKLVRNEDERLDSVRRSLIAKQPELEFDRDGLDEAVAKMIDHPSEWNVDLITPDIQIPSLSVNQLHLLATEIATMDMNTFIQTNQSRNNQSQVFSYG